MNPYNDYPYPWADEQYRKEHRLRKMRHTYSVQGWTVLIYMGIMNAVVMLAILFGAVGSTLSGAGEDQWLAERCSGWGYLLTIGVGLLILLLWKKPHVVFGTLWRRGRPMKPGRFLEILSVFMGTQLVFILLSMLAEFLLQRMGLTVVSDSALEYDGLSMFLYVGIGAPISEELLFRGLLLRSMESYGKKFAIFATALLFGLFHGNLSQAPYAFCVGLVLGYVTVEYNIGWAMVLHMFNNMIISDAADRLGRMLPENMMNGVLGLVLVMFTLAAVVILIRRRRLLRAYLRSNPDDPDCARAFWSAPGIIVLICVLGMTILASVLTTVVPLS